MTIEPVILEFLENYETLSNEEQAAERERIYSGCKYYFDRNLLRAKGLNIFRNFEERHVNDKYLSDPLLSVCVGICELGWYTFPKSVSGCGRIGQVYCAIDRHTLDVNTMDPDPTDGTMWLNFHLKIGFSQDPKKRIESFKTALPAIKLITTLEAPQKFETFLQDTLDHIHIDHFEHAPDWIQWSIPFVCASRIEKSEWFSVFTAEDWDGRKTAEAVIYDKCRRLLDRMFEHFSAMKKETVTQNIEQMQLKS